MRTEEINFTYCANIHPISSVDTLCDILNQTVPEIAQNSHIENFKLGLWLPAHALKEALQTSSIERIKQLLQTHNFEVITFNAFPMNTFHGESVKTKVYNPDWSTIERLNYTQEVAKLAHLLGNKKTVISTLSGGFKENDNDEKIEQYIKHWLEWVRFAKDYEDDFGFLAQCALEPEPFNTLEDDEDIVQLWKKIEAKCKGTGLSMEDVNRYLGICLDTCHFSVRFISPLKAFERLRSENIPVFKTQLSISPRYLNNMQNMHRDDFFLLNEPVYLHQTYAKNSDNEIHSFLDLDVARQSQLQAEEWRTHFHIPIFLSENQNTTGQDLIDFVKGIQAYPNLPILEIETYSFAALKRLYQVDLDINQSITKELLWLTQYLKS